MTLFQVFKVLDILDIFSDRKKSEGDDENNEYELFKMYIKDLLKEYDLFF